MISLNLLLCGRIMTGLIFNPATRERSYATLAYGQSIGKAFIEATDHMIRNYFSHPSYWKVNGSLYFSIYELMSLIEGLGGIDETRRILNDFRNRVRAAGLGELHLNAVVWGVQILPGEKRISNPNEMLEILVSIVLRPMFGYTMRRTSEIPENGLYMCLGKSPLKIMKGLQSNIKYPTFQM